MLFCGCFEVFFLVFFFFNEELYSRCYLEFYFSACMHYLQGCSEVVDGLLHRMQVMYLSSS